MSEIGISPIGWPLLTVSPTRTHVFEPRQHQSVTTVKVKDQDCHSCGTGRRRSLPRRRETTWAPARADAGSLGGGAGGVARAVSGHDTPFGGGHQALGITPAAPAPGRRAAGGGLLGQLAQLLASLCEGAGAAIGGGRVAGEGGLRGAAARRQRRQFRALGFDRGLGVGEIVCSSSTALSSARARASPAAPLGARRAGAARATAARTACGSARRSAKAAAIKADCSAARIALAGASSLICARSGTSALRPRWRPLRLRRGGGPILPAAHRAR